MGTHREQARITGLGMMAISVLGAIVAIAIVLAVGGHLRTVVDDLSISDARGASVAPER